MKAKERKDKEIHGDLVETLFGTHASFIAGLFGGLTAPVSAFLFTQETVYLDIAAAMAMIGFFRTYLMFSHHFAPLAQRHREAPNWEFFYGVGAVAFMFSIGVTGALLLHNHPGEIAEDYGIIIMMSCAGALAARNAGCPQIVFGQMMALCAPMTVAVLMQSDWRYWGLAVIFALLMMSIKSTTRFLHSNLDAALRNGYDAREQRLRLSVALNTMSHGLCMGDPDLNIHVVNRRVTEFFGIVAATTPISLESLTTAIGRNAGLPQEEIAAFVERWRVFARAARPGVFSQTIGENIFDFRCEPGDKGGFVTVIEDVTVQRGAVREIERLALFDSLTTLPNRHQFQQQLDAALRHLPTTGGGLALLNIDLDRFKEVNDTLGHAFGDELLCAVAERLRQQVNPTDVVARFGGDEFCVLLPEVEAAEAALISERLIAALRAPYLIEQHRITIDASIGVAMAPHDATAAEELLRFSDLALYSAKNAGRGRVCVFEAKIQIALEKRRQLEEELRRAVERDELVLFYQPIVDARSGRVVGLEALMRWRSPTRGLVSPAEFIPIAEDTGLIVPLGAWAMQKACRDAATLSPEIRVSVNLSTRQFQNEGLAAMIRSSIASAGLAPRRLEVEITESMLMQDTDEASRKIKELAELGVALALDDFGTGYSSLGYLSRFPVNKIKLDRAFTIKLPEPKTLAIVGAIANIARDLDMDLVAEGVENHEQLTHLSMKGVFLIQGFLFSRPKPLDELIQEFPSLRPARALTHVA